MTKNHLFRWLRTIPGRRSYYAILIRFAFIEKDRQTRDAYEKRAKARYPFRSLRVQADAIKEDVEGLLVKVRQDEYIHHVRARCAAEKTKKDQQDILNILLSPHSEKLKELHNRKKTLITDKRQFTSEDHSYKSEIDDAYSDKEEAHALLVSAKSDVDSWHARSKSRLPLYGKHGKNIPNWSLFGMSHGDLESAKDRRDNAWSEFEDAKSRIDSLKQQRAECFENANDLSKEIGSVLNEIKEVQSERVRCQELRGQGVTCQSTKKLIKEAETVVCEHQTVVREINKQRGKFKQSELVRRGFFQLEEEANCAERTYQTLMTEFDSPNALAERKARFTWVWLRQRRRRLSRKI